jgi:hypothetical protein
VNRCLSHEIVVDGGHAPYDRFDSAAFDRALSQLIGGESPRGRLLREPELTNEAIQELTARGLFSERGRRLLRA